MNLLMKLCALVLVGGLAACGGGGGSAGLTNNTGTGTPSTNPNATSTIATTTNGTMTLSLVTADGTVIADGKLSQTQEMFLRATVRDSAGALVGGARVVFTLDSNQAVLVPVNGVALTGLSSGVASIKVAPASVSALGIVTASASATLNGSALVKDLYLDISPGLVQLANLQLSPTTLQKGQALVSTVDVLVNGLPATSNSVSVNFSSLCGTASPASAVVDSLGKATAVIQSNNVGSCVATASYNGISVTQSFVVTAPPITGVQFVSAAPQVIYQKGSTGATTSIVKFKVINSVGDPVQSVPVSATLTNVDGGIDFCGSPYNSLPSGASGEVEFSVCSGTLPATVQVKASLDSLPQIYTLSNLLTVQTGLPTQRFFDISASQFNFYAGGYFTNKFNGNDIEISVFAADRQGNPVPAGTNIVFVTEGGQFVISGTSSCQIGNAGRCSVKLVGQDYRPMGSSVPGADPRPGRVTVLAYADGEESFIDANNNNRYDPGELFEDIGLPYIDKDEDGVRTAAYSNLVIGTNEGESTFPLPTGASGNTACPSNVAVGLSAQNTCNNVWDAATKVRRKMVIVFSGDEIGDPLAYDSTIPANKRTQILAISRSGARVLISDLNGNPLPSTTSLSASVLGGVGGACKVTLIGSAVGNSIEPTAHSLIFDQCSGGEVILFKSLVQSKESVLQITVP